MAIEKPKDLSNSALGAATSSKKGSNGFSINNALDLDNFYNKQYKSKNADTFKSLDFSDVSIYGKGDSAGTASSDEQFRHFHQMRLFIQTGATYHHNTRGSYQTVITSNLPERIQYALDSKWEQPLNFGDATFNLLMQIGSQIAGAGDKIPSGTLRASTFKIWTNTTPLTLDLTIPVIDDGNDLSGTNLVEALEILGSLVLPSYSGDSAGFYIPPPSPLAMNIKYGTISTDVKKQNIPRDFVMATNNSARIMLQLGGILLVDNCVIEKLSVEYPNTKAQIMHDYSKIKNKPYFGMTNNKYLHPLLAIVNLRISTLEALTANTYSRMLWAKPQSEQGNLTADITKASEYINKAINFAMNNDEKKEE